jgi:hypothetical protein
MNDHTYLYNLTAFDEARLKRMKNEYHPWVVMT